MSYENQWGKNTYFGSKLIYPANQFLFGSSLLVILFMYYFINLSLFLHECSKGQDLTLKSYYFILKAFAKKNFENYIIHKNKKDNHR